MPFTPLHLGPGLFFGTIFIKYIDLVGFLLGNIILDVEPGLVVLYNLNYEYRSYPHHAFFHTILGAVLVSLLTAIVLNKIRIKIREKIKKASFLKKFFEEAKFSKIFFSVFAGTILHLFFDSLMHYDVFPLWPSHFNPLLRIIPLSWVYRLCIIMGMAGLILLVVYSRKIRNNKEIK